MSAKKLYRSRTDKSLGGVCSGVAKYFGWDTGLVRMITAIAILFGGVSFWLYILAWIIIPEEPADPYYDVPVVEEEDDEEEW